MANTKKGKKIIKTEPVDGIASSREEHSQQGNLGSLLTRYDNSQHQSSSSRGQQPALTIDIPAGMHGGGIKDEERDRSLTMGSEFDQIFSHLGKDGRGMSISGLLTPLGDAMSEGTNTTAISGSTASTFNSVGVQQVAGAAPQSHLPRLPEYATSSSSSGNNTMKMDVTPLTSNYSTATSIAIPVGRGRGESHGSATMFLNGIYNNNSSNATNLQQSQVQKHHQPISHTPPSHFGTSYENSHFGKRMRAGVSLRVFDSS